MIGYPADASFPRRGTTTFSSSAYWSSTVSTYPSYVYNNNSQLYNYIENYKVYLEKQGIEIEEARLLKKEELETLGCSSSCSSAPSWVYATSYWTGTAYNSSYLWLVDTTSSVKNKSYSNNDDLGVRPIIAISKEVIRDAI